MNRAGVGKIVRLTLAVITGAIAISAYAGVVGLTGGGVFGGGLLLVAWIAVELAIIKPYSWFHPTYLNTVIVVPGMSWTTSLATQTARLELRDTQLHS
jgi:hypothetical protein